MSATDTLAKALASDLGDLAAMLVKHPELAEHVASAVSDLHAVLQRSTDPLPQQIIDAAVDQGAEEVRPPTMDAAWFPCRTVRFPQGTVRLSVTMLDPTGFAQLYQRDTAGGAR